MTSSSPIYTPARRRNSSLLDDPVYPDGHGLDISERTLDNAPTSRVKHLVLDKRHELYEKLKADFAQVADECNGENLRRNSDGENPPLVDEANDNNSTGIVRASSADGLRATYMGHRINRRHPENGGKQNSVINNCHPICSSAKEMQPRQEKQPSEQGRRLSVNSDISIASSHNEDFESLVGFIKPSRPARRISVESDVSMGSSIDDEDGSSARKNEQLGLMLGVLCKISGNNHVPHDADNTFLAKRRQSEDALLSPAESCSIYSAESGLVSSKPCSGLSVKLATDSKVQLRKKHQPQHRCPSVNGSVTGIVKAPRYSGNTSLTDQATERRGSCHDSPTANGRRRLSRRISLPTPPELSKLKASFTQMMPSAIHEKALQHMESLLNSSIISDTASITPSINSNATSSEKWIPSGVDFSTTMEVYVFEK